MAVLSMLAACVCLPLAKAIRAWHRVRVAVSPPVPEARAVPEAVVPSAPPLALEVHGQDEEEGLHRRERFFFHTPPQLLHTEPPDALQNERTSS